MFIMRGEKIEDVEIGFKFSNAHTFNGEFNTLEDAMTQFDNAVALLDLQYQNDILPPIHISYHSGHIEIDNLLRHGMTFLFKNRENILYKVVIYKA